MLQTLVLKSNLRNTLYKAYAFSFQSQRTENMDTSIRRKCNILMEWNPGRFVFMARVKSRAFLYYFENIFELQCDSFPRIIIEWLIFGIRSLLVFESIIKFYVYFCKAWFYRIILFVCLHFFMFEILEVIFFCIIYFDF